MTDSSQKNNFLHFKYTKRFEIFAGNYEKWKKKKKKKKNDSRLGDFEKWENLLGNLIVQKFEFEQL